MSCVFIAFGLLYCKILCTNDFSLALSCLAWPCLAFCLASPCRAFLPWPCLAWPCLAFCLACPCLAFCLALPRHMIWLLEVVLAFVRACKGTMERYFFSRSFTVQYSPVPNIYHQVPKIPGIWFCYPQWKASSLTYRSRAVWHTRRVTASSCVINMVLSGTKKYERWGPLIKIIPHGPPNNLEWI